MSIEVELGRIATALEKQNALTESLIGNTNQALPSGNSAGPAPKEKKAPKAVPVVQTDPEVSGMFDDPAPKDEGVTLDVLKELLTQHAKAFGTKVTLATIISHGADKETPKIATIPEANWKACFDQVTADLKKVKK